MKLYTAQSSAKRAGARELNIAPKEVTTYQTETGEWGFVTPEVKPVASKSKKVFRRPGADAVLTGRVWELADTKSRKEVFAAAKEEGLNLGMVAQQYYRWANREEEG